jgi:hypothetical protein
VEVARKKAAATAGAPGSRSTSEAPASQSSSAADWYCADSPDRSVRQIVMSFPPESAAETGFGLIMLPPDKYPVLSMQSWCAGFCTINGQSVAMFRAGDFASRIKPAGVTMAVSFCHMPSHGFLLLSVRAESPQLTASVRRKHSHVPPLARPVAEWMSALAPYDRELIPAVFRSETFRLTLAGDSGSTSSVMKPDGSWQEAAMPLALCEFHKRLTADLKKAFDERWRALLAYDATIPRYRRDFQTAVGKEVVAVLPLDKDPILSLPHQLKPEPAKASNTREATAENNLMRWKASGNPEEWVRQRNLKWAEKDWLGLLASLRRSEFWPMDESAIEVVLGAITDRLRAEQRAST